MRKSFDSSLQASDYRVIPISLHELPSFPKTSRARAFEASLV